MTLEGIRKQIENLENQQIIFILVVTLLLFYLILTQTQRGIAVRKKFRILPKLIPLDDYDEIQIKEPEKIDGRTKRVEGKTVPKSDNIIDAEEITDSKNLNNLKNLGKVIGAGAVGTGIYKATSDENEKNEKDEKDEKDEKNQPGS